MKLLKLLKKIIVGTVLFIVKEFFSFIIKLSLLLIIIGVIVGGIVKYSMKEEKSSIKSGSYVEIDLGKEYLEKIEGLPKFLLDGDMNFYSLLKRLDGVAKDARIEGVLLKIDNCTLDRAQIEELGEKIDSLKVNGKKVIAYGMDINNKNYSLALHAEQIFMPATMSANINIIGYYNELAYYKGLADKLGIKFNVIHVGDYKSYGENFVKKEMSKEYKENIIRLQDKIYNNFLENVVSRRKIDKKLINERILAGDFVFSEPYQMEKYNLIDGLKYEEDLKEMIGRDKIIPISNYQEIQKISKNKIAVIYAEGNIVLGEEKGNFGQSITPNKIILELERARKDKNIKGIVLRINSPGGSALASNIINRKIKEVGKEKPVYVSIGGVAASGGYYIAVAGDKIYAEKESLTGSIGVVSLIPNFKELLGKIDVNVEVVKKGEYSDLFSLSKEFTEKDEEKIYASSLKVYSEFLDVVAQGRKLDRNYVHSIAQGKVWLGEEGKELGLVDGIGGLEATISSLAKDLDLVDYMSVEIVEEEKIDSIIKGYLPFKVFSKELYFKPIYFFPYNI